MLAIEETTSQFMTLEGSGIVILPGHIVSTSPGPKIVYSETSEECKMLHWRLRVMGNPRLEIGILPAVMPFPVSIRICLCI
jgi:hypothetical protein